MPLSKTGAELLFEVFRLSAIERMRVDPGDLDEHCLHRMSWTEIFGSERPDRKSFAGTASPTMFHILEMNGESYRLNQSQKRPEIPKNTGCWTIRRCNG